MYVPGVFVSLCSKEYAIERAIDGMQNEWKPVEFGTSEYRDSGTFIIRGAAVEEAQTILDDHIVKTQTMKGSSFAKPFAEEIAGWERWLVDLQDLLEIWTKVQSTWLYLEPIFSSDDIMKQMPEEGSMFQLVDLNWRRIMAEVCLAFRAIDISVSSFYDNRQHDGRFRLWQHHRPMPYLE